MGRIRPGQLAGEGHHALAPDRFVAGEEDPSAADGPLEPGHQTPTAAGVDLLRQLHVGRHPRQVPVGRDEGFTRVEQHLQDRHGGAVDVRLHQDLPLDGRTTPAAVWTMAFCRVTRRSARSPDRLVGPDPRPVPGLGPERPCEAGPWARRCDRCAPRSSPSGSSGAPGPWPPPTSSTACTCRPGVSASCCRCRSAPGAWPRRPAGDWPNAGARPGS